MVQVRLAQLLGNVVHLAQSEPGVGPVASLRVSMHSGAGPTLSAQSPQLSVCVCVCVMWTRACAHVHMRVRGRKGGEEEPVPRGLVGIRLLHKREALEELAHDVLQHSGSVCAEAPQDLRQHMDGAAPRLLGGEGEARKGGGEKMRGRW